MQIELSKQQMRQLAGLVADEVLARLVARLAPIETKAAAGPELYANIGRNLAAGHEQSEAPGSVR